MILKVNGLSKSYGRLRALNSVSFQVNKGSVFGILGPNGSGKTTLLGCLTDILIPNSGTFDWFGGIDPTEARRKIGAIIETPNFYGYLSAVDNLAIVAAIKGVSLDKIDIALEKVGLSERKNSPFRTYSLGMKQRLSLASALLSEPEVLILDEPTNGLDPQGINDIRSLISEQASKGTTVILASHLLSEIEKVCSDVLILKKGNIIAGGKVDELLGSSNLITIASDNNDLLINALQECNESIEFEKQNEWVKVKLPAHFTSANLNEFLAKRNIFLNHITKNNNNLEDAFLKLVSDNQDNA
jgi:ABC-2 type transport system ATP-binding protein